MAKITQIISIFIIVLFFNILSSISSEPIRITRGSLQEIPIAVNIFDSNSGKERNIADNITAVINNDLRNSAIFHPISSQAFLENKYGIDHIPLFAAWRQINASILVNGKVSYISSKKVKISFTLWDVLSEAEIAKEALELDSNLWRRAAHKIADRVYESVTGEKGYFDTKILYISESGSLKKRIRRIAIMDQDGANHYYITDGKNLVITPVFSPKNDQILYVAYHNKIPRVHLRNLYSGKDMLLGNFSGITFAPKFSPDGNKVLVSISTSQSAATHIYEINLSTRHVKQLTRGMSINTSPSYSPDGQKIAFTSDRSGSPQIYVMDANGNNPQQISSNNGSYTTPSWSPKNNYIAFTKAASGEGFSIGVMRLDGSDERLIANGYLVEGPSWAPNGKTIVFARTFPSMGQNPGDVKLYSIDCTGYNERELKTPKNGSDPNWSSLQ